MGGWQQEYSVRVYAMVSRKLEDGPEIKKVQFSILFCHMQLSSVIQGGGKLGHGVPPVLRALPGLIPELSLWVLVWGEPWLSLGEERKNAWSRLLSKYFLTLSAHR